MSQKIKYKGKVKAYVLMSISSICDRIEKFDCSQYSSNEIDNEMSNIVGVISSIETCYFMFKECFNNTETSMIEDYFNFIKETFNVKTVANQFDPKTDQWAPVHVTTLQ